MKRALFALFALALSGSVFGGINGNGGPLSGFGLDLNLVSVSNDGRSATWDVTWFGPGYYRINPLTGYGYYYYGGYYYYTYYNYYGGNYSFICPAGDCDGANYGTSYYVSDFVLPPGGAGIFTHTSVYLPRVQFNPYYGGYTTYSVHSTVTSQPNNLHGFILVKHQQQNNGTTYPVTYKSSYPGTSVAGPGRNYIATINVTGLTPGEYSASAFQRLLHYRTYTTNYYYYYYYYYYYPKYGNFCGLCVGGTDDFPYIYDTEPLFIPATIPVMDRGGLIALALMLLGIGVLVLQRKPALRTRV